VQKLAIEPKSSRYKPSRCDAFLRPIKISSISSFGSEVKLEVPCHKFLWNVKDPLMYLKY
jgi:hypothetical protein